MQLTPHFTLQELTDSETALRNGWDNTPTPEALANLRRLADFLEQVRALLGKPVVVSSGYRSKQVNDAVGSKDSSQHRTGQAADIKVSGMTPRQVVKSIINSGLPFDQVIEEFGAWTHVSIPAVGDPPRFQALAIDREGTRAFA